MAKMTKKFDLKRFNRAIDQIKQKMQYNESYILVLNENQQNNRLKKIADLKVKQQAILFDIWGKTLSSKEYCEIFSKEELGKLDQSFYWKKRAIKQKYNRKQKNSESPLELSETKYQKDLLELNIKYESKKESIIANHQGGETDTIIAANKILLQNEEKKLGDELIAFEKKLIQEDERGIQEFELKIKEKNDKLNTKLENLKRKKKIISSDVETHQLPEDVVLRLSGLRMQFGGLVAVDDLTFDVKKGEVFGLIGPNGAGKTTVFNCITQFYKPTAGQMLYRDKNNDIVDLNDYAVHDVIKHGIVRTFQNVELIWELSILDNLLIASHTQYQSNFFGHLIHSRKFKREEKILKAKALKILADLGLFVYKDFYPIGLPYGVLKLVELARTLMTNPKLIILDEPAAGLNDLESEKLVQTIRKIQKEYDCTIFLVEHDMGLVMELCDTICAISFGKKLAIGTPKEIQANKIVQEAYLGGE